MTDEKRLEEFEKAAKSVVDYSEYEFHGAYRESPEQNVFVAGSLQAGLRGIERLAKIEVLKEVRRFLDIRTHSGVVMEVDEMLKKLKAGER